MANTSYLGVGPADRDPTVSDDSVTTAKIQDNAVTGPKIAMTSDAAGDILTYTGTDYARLGIGTASQVLKVNGAANAVEWAADTVNAGDVVGPGSATDDALARFNATTGKLIQNSTATLTDAGVLTVSNIAATIDTTTQNSVTTMTGLTTVGTIGTGTWQGTAIADAYIGNTINATHLADGTVTNAELQYINSLSSNAQTQLTAKAALATAQTFTAGQRGEITALTSATSVTIDMADSNNFSCTMAHNIVFENPSNDTAGQSGSIFLTQDGTGSRTASWGTDWEFAGGTAPTLTTTAAASDRIDYVIRSGTSIQAVATLALA